MATTQMWHLFIYNTPLHLDYTPQGGFMNWMLLLCIVIWTLFFAMQGYQRYATRLFPKHVARRAIKKKQRDERSLAKYRQRKAVDEARLKQWAQNNPDDPLARTYLAQETAIASTSDPAAELRRRQEEEDAYQLRRENRRLAEELLAQQMLDWAVDNPTSPEARRHLEEQLEKVSSDLELTYRDAEHCKSILAFSEGVSDETDIETMRFRDRLIEAEAKMKSQQQFIRRIQLALGVPVPDISR